MIAIQIVGVVIGLTAIYLTNLYFKRRSFTVKEFIFWIVIWFAFIVVTVFPHIVQPIVGVFGLQRPMDLIMIAAFIVLFGVTFYTYVVTHRLEKQIEKLVRKLALDAHQNDQEQRQP